MRIMSSFTYVASCADLHIHESQFKKMTMKSTTLLCLPLLLSPLVAAQIYPHLSFMVFSNHSYIDLNLIGENDNNALQCSTDLTTCCSSTQGDHRGDWYYPNGEILQISSAGGADIYQLRDDRVVKLLRRNGAVSPTGIYRCEIATIAAIRNNDSDGNTLRDVLYVGLYDSGGDLEIQGEVEIALSYDHDGDSLPVTLTCISTGGPATTVTWTRDSVTITEGTETVLNDPVTAQYTHTLTVTENLGGLYTCTVANNKPSLVNSTITLSVEDILLSISVTTATTISISWTSVAGSAGSYEVIWQRDITVGCTNNHKGSATITDGSTSYDITDLHEDSSYFIIITTSDSSGRVYLSNAITAMTQEAAPSAAPTNLRTTYVDSYTIILSWGPLQRCRDNNGIITGYIIQYGSETTTVTVNTTEDSSEAIITDLSPTTLYPVSVAAINSAGAGPYSSPPVNVVTHDVGVPYVSVDYDNIQATSIPISWVDSHVGGNGVSAYELEWETDDVGGCSGDSHMGTRFISDDSITSLVIMDLEENSSYTITVIAHGTLFCENDTITAMTLEAVPAGPPTDVTLSAVTAYSITVQWNEVECIHRNGHITGYTIQYSIENNTNTQSEAVTDSEAQSVVLTGLLPSTSYSVKVAAINSAGRGEYSEAVTIETSQGFQIYLSGFIVCSEWKTYSTNEKVQEITNALITELNTSCQCQVTADFIIEAQISCHTELSNTFIYQASFNHTLQDDSSEIMEHLNKWITSNPTLRVQGVLMSVGQTCVIESTTDFGDACNSTSISVCNATCNEDIVSSTAVIPTSVTSCNETGGISSMRSSPMTTRQSATPDMPTVTDFSTNCQQSNEFGIEIVVGVAIGVAVVTALLVVMATLITFRVIRCKREHRCSFSKKPCDGSDSTNFDGTTIPNMAYNMTNLTRERRSSFTGSYEVISNPQVHTSMIDTQNMTSSIMNSRERSNSANSYDVIQNPHAAMDTHLPPAGRDRPQLPLPAIPDGSYEVNTPENIKRLRQQQQQQQNETNDLYTKIIDNT